jgi:hypothetical protein
MRHDANRKAHCLITTSNPKLCYACSFYVIIIILYYCNIVWILYIWKCQMKHFVLYIEYYENNQMCEIFLMVICTTIFYMWRVSISIQLWGIRERFYNMIIYFLKSLQSTWYGAMINVNIKLFSWYTLQSRIHYCIMI